MTESERVRYADGMRRAAAEFEAWANSHATLQAGHGNADDAKAFTAWLLALADDIAAGKET